MPRLLPVIPVNAAVVFLARHVHKDVGAARKLHRLLAGMAGVPQPHLRQRCRIAHARLTQQKLQRDGKHRRVDADPQRQRQQRTNHKARATPHAAYGEHQIAPQIFKEAKAPQFKRLFLQYANVAQRNRIPLRPRHLTVKRHLGLKVLFHPLPPPKL